jgi:hypothetical protein
VPGTVTLPLCSRTNASPFWMMLLLVWGGLEHGMIHHRRPRHSNADGGEAVHASCSRIGCMVSYALLVAGARFVQGRTTDLKKFVWVGARKR